MKGYIAQIDSLNTLNIALRKEATAARKDAELSRQQYDELKTTTEQYAEKASAGAVVKGRGVALVAENKSQKTTDRSSRVVRLKTCLSLIENSIAEISVNEAITRIGGGPAGNAGEKKQMGLDYPEG